MNLLLGTFGFIVGSAIALLALRRGSLSPSGAGGAIVIGTLTMAFGGWSWAALIVTFFASSTLLSHLGQEEKATAAVRYDKGHRRDLGQVLANGGLATAVAVLHGLVPAPIWYFCFVGIVATVTADTWATELGGLSRRTPRLITSGRPVPAGTSGGITPLGLMASLGGGLLIGAVAALWMPELWLRILFVTAIGGTIGSLVDSLLGATIQRIYYDERLPGESERATVDGRALPIVRGWRWMSNDVVNFLASAAGGLAAIVLATLL